MPSRVAMLTLVLVAFYRSRIGMAVNCVCVGRVIGGSEGEMLTLTRTVFFLGF